MKPDERDLDWLSFQYIAGELPTTEATEFEARLEVDQDAREAVARAVELAHVTALAQDHVSEPVRLPVAQVAVQQAAETQVAQIAWTRRLAWMACGAAACLLLVFLQSSRSNPLDGSSSTVGSLGVESTELALAWAQSRSESPVASVDSPDGSPNPHADGADSEDDGIAAPSWMLVAVAGLTMEQIE